MDSNSPTYPNPNTRLRVFREFLGESQQKFGSRFGKKQRTYANYEDEGAAIPTEVREGSARLGLNLNWLDTGEGPMVLAVKEVQPGHKGTYPIQGHASGQAGATGSLGAREKPATKVTETHYWLAAQVVENAFNKRDLGGLVNQALRETLERMVAAGLALEEPPDVIESGLNQLLDPIEAGIRKGDR